VKSREVRPPHVAAWLVDLFAPADHAESLLGDLSEEFSDLALKSGPSFARRWYWRQSVKTVTHLVGTAFRVSPWTTIGPVVAGYVLLGFGFSLPERAIVMVLHLRHQHVNPYYTSSQIEAYLFWLNNGILVGRLLMSLSIGSIVAVAAKGREIIATMALSLLLVAPFLVLRLAGHWPNQPFLPSTLIFAIGNSLMIVVGGDIVRKNRSAALHRPSSA